MTQTVRFRAPSLAASLLLVFGSCTPQIPETVSPVDVAGNAADEPPDMEGPRRLRTCLPGTADCDREPANDCEVVLADDPKNCGECGVQCALPHAEPGCLGGTCRIVSCSPGYCDSDADPDNGCETAAKTCPRAP